MKFSLPILLLGLLFANCGDDNNNVQLSYSQQLELDREIIQDYLTANNLTAIEGELGLFYLIEKEGEGTTNPNAVSTVIIDYKGYLPNGDVFDEGDALQISLQNTIGGWQVGIPNFKKGGVGKLFIPSSLGYGQYGNRGIPGNQVLIFDVELINFL